MSDAVNTGRNSQDRLCERITTCERKASWIVIAVPVGEYPLVEAFIGVRHSNYDLSVWN